MHLYASTVGMRKQREGVGATSAAMGVGKTIVTEVIAILVLSYLGSFFFFFFALFVWLCKVRVLSLLLFTVNDKTTVKKKSVNEAFGAYAVLFFFF